MGDDKADTRAASAEPVTPAVVLSELHRHEKSEKWQLKVQTVVLLVGLVGTVLTGARWLVTSTWAQGKEHVDAGITVLRAEFEAHKNDEAGERARTRDEVGLMRDEQYKLRQELRGLYDYQKTGRLQPMLEAPLPPPPSKDGGR